MQLNRWTPSELKIFGVDLRRTMQQQCRDHGGEGSERGGVISNK